MNDKVSNTVENANSPTWLSTYGLLTAERLLERFQITLSHEELLDALQNPSSPYHHLLTVPIKNISNGIVIKQVHDYQVYMQKLFIDYKLSSPNAGAEGAPSQNSNEEIDIKYNELGQLSELFDEKKHEHQQLIAKSQSWLIQQTRESMLEITPETSSQIETFGTQTESLRLGLLDQLQQFRDLIIQTSSVLNAMTDYKPDLEQMEENKALLDFDPLFTEVESEGEN
ncbi:MAG: hypothetical protein P1U36_09850 [Legionellaceae bacterium]|nr:hypothetical protein [Legionellaceae bacterium]